MEDSKVTHRHPTARQDSFATVDSPSVPVTAVTSNNGNPNVQEGRPAGVIHAPSVLPKEDPLRKEAAYVAFEKAGIENPAADAYDEEDDAIARAINSVVPQTDDPNIPQVTFRSVVLGTLFAVVLAGLNAIFAFRTSYFSVADSLATLLSYPMGIAMARLLPTTSFTAFGRQWSLNPGPFSKKEHVVAYMICSAAGGVPYGIDNVVAQKMVVNQEVTFAAGFFFVLATQMTGLGFAGILRRFVVWPREMLWPGNFGDLSLFASFWDRDSDLVGETNKYSMGRYTFFWIFATCWCLYEWVPLYLFSALQAVSLLCWFTKNNAVKQIASSNYGLGYLTFTFDWQYVLTYPMTTPFWVTVVSTLGVVFWTWILVPIVTATGMAGSELTVGTLGERNYNDPTIYDSTGEIALSSDNVFMSDFSVNDTFIESAGPFQITTFFYINYVSSFFMLTSSLSHVYLWYGPQIKRQLKAMRAGEGRDGHDVHNELMRAYPEVPEWAYAAFALVFFVVMLIVGQTTVFTLPWWTVFLATGVNLVFLLPLAVIVAISGQSLGLNVITEFIAGLIMPGKVITVMCFKSYGYNVLAQAIVMLGDLKFGHYLHLAPWVMFGSQVWGNFVGSLVSTGASLFAIENWGPSGSNMINKLSVEWNAIQYYVFFDAGILWGAIGPAKFFSEAYHNQVYWAFFAGAVLPILPWLANKYYPSRWWVYMNLPLFSFVSGVGGQQNFTWTTLILGFFFQFYLYRHKFAFWSKYVYTIQVALDVGTAITIIITSFVAASHPGPIWAGNPNGEPDYYCYGASYDPAPSSS
ncbi:hypothetical protein HKX48_001882 [Thoreauomyces humboldtii]|nr:hypothetical protein HKX48_001882 [Thoreauomyces humboldtii]